MTLITPLASSIFAPAVHQVLDEFKETDKTIASFVVSIYVLGYAVGPLLIAPLRFVYLVTTLRQLANFYFSELHGRTPVYHVTNVLFVIFTVCCAVSQNVGMLITFRFLAGVCGSTPM